MKSVTLLPGAFIGPEIIDAVRKVFQAAKVPVHFDIIEEFDFRNQDQKMALND